MFIVPRVEMGRPPSEVGVKFFMRLANLFAKNRTSSGMSSGLSRNTNWTTEQT